MAKNQLKSEKHTGAWGKLPTATLPPSRKPNPRQVQ
jgi:hypothetical protein